MRIAIFVYETTTLIFTPPPDSDLILERLGGDARPLAAKMPAQPGVYKIESGTRITPAPDRRIEVVVDVDVMGEAGDPKEPFPPEPPPKALELEAKSVIQGFFADSLGVPLFAAGDVAFPR